MRAGPAEIQLPDRRCVPRPFQQWTRDEPLIEGELAVKDVAAGQAIRALEIQRRDDFPRDHSGCEAGGVTLDGARGGGAETVALGIPSAPPISRSRQVQSGS